MKNVQKKLIYFLTIVVIFSFTILPTNIVVTAATTNDKNIDLVILFNDNSIDKNVKDIVTNSGGKILNEFPELGGIEVECPAKLIPAIKSQTSVHSLSPNHIIKLSNEKSEEFTNSEDNLYENYQWDIKRVTNNGESFNLESGNHDVIVGIIDSGVDKTHPDLINNFLGGKNLVPANFGNDPSETGNSNDITDKLGHGTNIAGIIAANGKIKGVAPNIGFKSYRIFNQHGDTSATICSSAIMTSVNDGVKVINLSLGAYDLKGKCYWTDPNTGIKYNLGDDMAEYSLFKRAIKYATENNVTVVAAAGNESLDCANNNKLTEYLNTLYGDSGFNYTGLTYEAPGDIKNVITVSATGKDDNVASYSNYGKKFIDISAPGGDIFESSNLSDMCLTTSINSDYIWTQGTSIAAPKVSAVAALIICKNNNITPKQVAKKIYKTAEKLDDGNSSKYYGAGMINAYKAIQ
ncbi:S8 family serine peptidase [Clostridium sp. C2-6-12]|uniref:S8 family peptidase n=1 Tax=Clostridium sp. C2-6-12 TaxID=2698832 RepID=UPI0013713ADF|nr:S8 family serine peptidase [Clostridium sp. C2-6-12]